MRLITRCPACGTMFKVVPDQLRISDGWVRCGHCAEVFDAPAHFFDPDAQPPVQPPPAEPAEPAAPIFHDEEPPAALPADASYPSPEPVLAAVLQDDPYVTDYFSAMPVAQEATAPRPEPEAEPQAAPPALAPADDVPPPPDDAAEPPAVTAAELEAWRRTREASSGVPPAASPVEDAPVDALPSESFASTTQEDEGSAASVAATPAFVRQADRRAFWRRPRVRALMSILMVVALLVLAGQVTYMERDRIAAHVPGARPVLERLCEPLGCQISGLRQIDSIVVDGSSFTRLRPDTYRLGVVLKSTASVPIAMPSVELTLTSLQGQTLLRRVLSPADLRAPAQLAAGAEWVGELPLVLDDADVASRVSGYAVLPFYP